VNAEPIKFRFDAGPHEYVDVGSGEVYPSITQLIGMEGLVDDQWFTEASRIRGTEVHRLTMDYDLGAIDDPNEIDSDYKGWFLAYVDAKTILGFEVLEVEVPRVHPVHLFAGRIDRQIRMDGYREILELKSGGKEKAHRIQTALQAILAASGSALKPHQWKRSCLYLKSNGRWTHDPHEDKADIDEAYRILERRIQR